MSIQKITIGNNTVDLRQINELVIVKVHHILSLSSIFFLATTGLVIAIFFGVYLINLAIAASLILAAFLCYYFGPLAIHSVRVIYINGRSIDLECLSNDDALKVKSRIDALIINEKG
jgi:cytochrome b subunit of formate dehydrogenase